jgi:betaine-aldehyde dehydrogenase
MRNTGKPIGDARGEMGMVVDTFAYYAAAPERLLGDTIPVAGGVDLTFREPLGVVGLIVPWNFPLTIASWKLAPALAAGNTVVLKPAELTPLTALSFAELAAEAGIPDGVVNVLAGPGRVVGRRLVEHPQVAKIAFTGSTEVGRGIMQGAAGTIKRVTLELGGKSANVVFADADLQAAAAAAPLAGVRQRRPGLLRPLPHPGRAAGHGGVPVAAGAGGDRPGRRRPGRRADPDGPADLGRPARDGGPLRARGHPGGHPRRRPPTGPAGGTRRPCSPRSRPATGRPPRRSSARSRWSCPSPTRPRRSGWPTPASTACPGSIWTRDLGRALRVARALETGTLSVNSNTSVRVATPFGGFKQSGVGRELGPHALDHYTELKNVFIAT